MSALLIKNSKNHIIIAEHKKCLHELIKGLMFKSNGNALLEFKKEKKHGIWMLFMKYGLKLYFLDKNLKVVDIKYAKPLTFNPRTWKVYYPIKPCKYVLEVDEREKFELEKGEEVEIEFFIP